jgi:hypothetical protein
MTASAYANAIGTALQRSGLHAELLAFLHRPRTDRQTSAPYSKKNREDVTHTAKGNTRHLVQVVASHRSI